MRGRHLLVGSLEYSYPIRENWDLAVFTDAGNAFDNRKPEIKLGYGAGVRWHSIIGTLRLDLASSGDGLRLHIFIGPEL
jgi:translocation and assembly module TamA